MPGFHCSVTVDPVHNVVRITQAGHAEREDLLRHKQEYEDALKQVRPGFVVINDQRGIRSFSDGAIEVGRELVSLTETHGAAKVIRIVAESVVSRTRVTRVLVSAQSSYAEVRVATPEAAELALQDHLKG